MTIPNSISTGALQELMENAQSERETLPQGPFAGYNEAQVRELCADIVETAKQRCNHPMVMKAMLLTTLSTLLQWHQAEGASAYENKEMLHALLWLRDAGKLQAAANILFTICMGDGDFYLNDSVPSNADFDGLDKAELKALVDEMHRKAAAECMHPMVNRCLADIILSEMIGWHSHQSMNMVESCQPAAAQCWAQDAGKFQAVSNILSTIQFGDDDFLCVPAR